MAKGKACGMQSQGCSEEQTKALANACTQDRLAPSLRKQERAPLSAATKRGKEHKDLRPKALHLSEGRRQRRLIALKPTVSRSAVSTQYGSEVHLDACAQETHREVEVDHIPDGWWKKYCTTCKSLDGRRAGGSKTTLSVSPKPPFSMLVAKPRTLDIAFT